MGRLRMVDTCALHDPAAAAEATGMQAEDLMPSDDLSTCTLQLAPKAGDLPVWRLNATAREVDERTRSKATPLSIGGVDVLKLNDDAGDADACGYLYPLSETEGLELRVRQRPTGQQRKDSCEVAATYLGAVARYWKNPATWSDKVTSPMLSTGAIDPCGKLDAAVEHFGRPVRFRYDGPHSCTMYPQTPAPGDPLGGLLTVTVGLDDDPTGDTSEVGSDKYEPITVAGRPGVSTVLNVGGGPAGTGTCYLTVVADDEVKVRRDLTDPAQTEAVQLIKAWSYDCDLATKAIEGLFTQR
ncbi:hypothetical protein [Actinokineospora pegani]|uniref:hypothetical protein n=1 Tax=Actinokineospora pegani TaxID=2654637 RepID=UPI0018D37306|nr:hypothetical protein [Actinokineospora pegani]